MRGWSAALLLCATAAHAQQLTLAEAVKRAIAAAPSVAAAEADLAAARATNAENRSALLPSVMLGSNATHYSDPMVATPIHGFTPGRLPEFDDTLVQSSLSANYTLFDAGARRARIAESERTITVAEAATEAGRQAIALRTTAAYASVRSHAAMVEAHDTRLTALRAEQDRVQQLEAAGRAAKVDVLRVDAALAAAEAERIAAAAALDQSEHELARVLNVSADETRASRLAPVRETATPIEDRAALEQRIDDSPAVRQARARAAAAHELIAAARSGRWPQIGANANALSFATDRSVLANEWNVGLQLRYSVFDAGATNARVARATAAARAADAQLASIRLENGVALDRAIADFEQSRATVASLAKAVERYAEVARIEKLRLENGAGTQTDYLRAEADLVAARANLAAASYGALVAQASIARITGQLDPQWLEVAFGSGR